MSIRNLFTDAVKPDQQLEVSVTDTDSLNITSFGIYTQDYGVSDIIDTITNTGRITFTNVGDIAIGAHRTVTVSNSEIIDANAIVLVNTITSQNAADPTNSRKITSKVNTIGTGSFTVDFLNYSEDTFTGGNQFVIFQYAILST